MECTAIRKEIESTFKIICGHMNYGIFMNYQFAFECPIHLGKGRDHLCVMDRTEHVPEVMLCLKNNKNPEPMELDNKHKVWFGQVSQIFYHHTYIFSSLHTFKELPLMGLHDENKWSFPHFVGIWCYITLIKVFWEKCYSNTTVRALFLQ